MSWQKLPTQTVLPRHDGGVDYGATRLLLLSRKMPDGTERRLEWRLGHTYWADLMNPKAYAPATLTISSTGGARDLGRDLLDGGRLTMSRLATVEDRIRQHFGLAADSLLPIDRHQTWEWVDT